VASDELHALLARLFQAHPWHGIPPRAADGALHGFIEIVPTDAVKYELDKPTGHLCVDRPQRFSNMCPTLYGFVPQTYCGDLVGQRCRERHGGGEIAGDGDPLDICVLTEKPFAHGNFLVRAVPIGGLRMIDRDQADDKIVAVLEADVAYGHFLDIGDCPTTMLDRLRHYFLTYKQQPGTPPGLVRIAEVYDRHEAEEVVRLACADYRAVHGAPESRLDQLRALLHTPGTGDRT
jgi:inorganic pyrophosphatase